VTETSRPVAGPALPGRVQSVLDELVRAASTAFGENLRSVVLFGSAAEGQLRATSDVNLIVVLDRFEPDQAAQFRGPMQLARAAIRASAMFLRCKEVEAVVEAFAIKFADITRRRRVLYGEDPFADCQPSRDAITRQATQTLLNLELRLREQLVRTGNEDAALARVVADAAAPLRVSAAALLELRGRPAASPKAALASLVEEWREGDGVQVLECLSRARQDGTLPEGSGVRTLVGLMAMAGRLRGAFAEEG
jgi:predicted nucleotidyltransferase